ncbi:hypothetical protein NE237_026513 [Protea cynaroides]|uniref:Uncharacterized protein n=1 Tax=Protea cynaroides TaxID=273540 RepID=A0A9Q0K1J3_9MAGN|nr:hypothetical protein NE237_026513 [Protea cynaroides]
MLLGVSFSCVLVYIDSIPHAHRPQFFVSLHANFLHDISTRIDSLEAKYARTELRWEIAKDAFARERDRARDQIGALREEAWRYRQRIATLKGEQAKHLEEKISCQWSSSHCVILCWKKFSTLIFWTSRVRRLLLPVLEFRKEVGNWDLFFFYVGHYVFYCNQL